MQNLSDLQPAIRVVMMPKDTNAFGTIFGGVILNYLDLAGVVEARRHSSRKLVTVAMREVKFIAPVYVGDLVSFYTETIKLGTKSVTVRVTVDAKRSAPPHEEVRVTQAGKSCMWPLTRTARRFRFGNSRKRDVYPP